MTGTPTHLSMSHEGKEADEIERLESALRAWITASVEQQKRAQKAEAEIERLRSELSEAREAFKVLLEASEQMTLDMIDARRTALLESAEIAENYDETETLTAPKHIADAIRRLAGEPLPDSHAGEIKRLREALESIAKNTCCDRCQEAALVARAALLLALPRILGEWGR